MSYNEQMFAPCMFSLWTDGPLHLEIKGADVVTIGIPYGFWCSAKCHPSCLYTFTYNGQTSYESELDIIFKRIVSSEVLTCEARNPTTGKTVSISKTLQVAGTVMRDIMCVHEWWRWWWCQDSERHYYEEEEFTHCKGCGNYHRHVIKVKRDH